MRKILYPSIEHIASIRSYMLVLDQVEQPEVGFFASLFHVLNGTSVIFGNITFSEFWKLLQVGTIALLALTGLTVFMLFFVAATVNAIVISLLMSLAAAGGFLALFFAFMTAIYIVALSVAIFVISTATISAIIAVLITTGKLVGTSIGLYSFFLCCFFHCPPWLCSLTFDELDCLVCSLSWLCAM